MGHRWTCPRCGCHTQHFSSELERYICDDCGFAELTESDRNRQEQYARSVSRAKKHLQVGDWDSCCSIIRPLAREYPADTLLYAILLASLTRGYEDLLMEDDGNRRMEAASVWDKLDRMHGINQTMRDYADSRRRARHALLRSRVYIPAVLLIGFIVAVYLSIVMSSVPAFFIFIIGGIIVVKRTVKKKRPFAAAKELLKGFDLNPFK